MTAPIPDRERLQKFRHDLAETQLLLLSEQSLDADTVRGLREIESLAIRMRGMLKEL